MLERLIPKEFFNVKLFMSILITQAQMSKSVLKLLISKTLKNIKDYVGQESLSQKLVDVWGDPSFIATSPNANPYVIKIAQSICICFKFFPVVSNDLQSKFMRSVSAYLSSPCDNTRSLGMVVSNYIIKIINPDYEKKIFDTDGSEYLWITQDLDYDDCEPETNDSVTNCFKEMRFDETEEYDAAPGNSNMGVSSNQNKSAAVLDDKRNSKTGDDDEEEFKAFEKIKPHPKMNKKQNPQ